MALPKLRYGLRDGELVHIDDAENGLACACICPECRRPLLAKQGEKLTHHFAHEADDVSCNPSPESLVHSYAKQQVAKLKKLTLPPFPVHASYKTDDSAVHELFWRYAPHFSLDVQSAEVEQEITQFELTLKPDVVFETTFSRVAVEVYFRHRVPPEKLEKLKTLFGLSTVEIDLSDLPAEASSQVINTALEDIKRWQWLHNQHERYRQVEMVRLLATSSRIFVPKPPQAQPRLSMHKLPSRKLSTADGMKQRAELLARDLRNLSTSDALQRVRALSTEMRIALHCHYIGIKPTLLPLHLMQTFDGSGAPGMHPIVWETGVFAKFCMSGGEFSARQVEDWVRAAFDDKELERLEGMTQSTNAFSAITEAMYHFLRNLSAQGLLREIKGKRPWESRFSPVAPSRAEVRERLLALPPALQ